MLKRVLIGATALVAALTLNYNYNRVEASQGSLCMPTTGTVSGLTFAQAVNTALDALLTSNSGSTSPTNPCGGLAKVGQLWLDTSSGTYQLKQYDGTSWISLTAFDSAAHVLLPGLGGGSTTLVSAGTTDLGSVSQSYISVTGTTTITSLGSSAPTGAMKVVSFAGILTLTNSGALSLPGGANILTAAGDRAIFVHLGSGNWVTPVYTPISGQAISNPAVPVGTVLETSATAAPTNYAFAYGQTVSRSSFAALLTATTISTSVTCVSGSPTLTGLSDTSQMGNGQPIEAGCLPIGTTIVGSPVSGSSVTVSNNASASTTTSAVVFPNGNGDGSTTFSIVDKRSRVAFGRPNMGGSLDTALTSSGCGGSGTVTALGVGCGNQLSTLLTSNLPPYTPSTTSQAVVDSRVFTTGATYYPAGGGPFQLSGGSNAGLPGAISFNMASPTSGTIVGNFTFAAQGGTSTGFSNVPPSRGTNYIVRMVP